MLYKTGYKGSWSAEHHSGKRGNDVVAVQVATIKNTLKIIAGSYADGQAMLKAAEETGKMLHIQLSSLYSDETKTADHLIKAGKLGKIYHGRSVGHRRRGRPFVDGYGTDRFVKKALAGGGSL